MEADNAVLDEKTIEYHEAQLSLYFKGMEDALEKAVDATMQKFHTVQIGRHLVELFQLKVSEFTL